MTGLRIASLCAGYAGLDLAVHEVLGGELAWVADNDPGASLILAHRFPSAPNLEDITAVDWAAVEPVDVLTAGFPCQDVSCAGGRAGLREGNRTGVWAHVARAIDELRPSLVVLENVRGLLSAGADSDMDFCPWCLGEAGDEHALRACGAVLGDLADLFYDARGAVVSAADAGAPHRRERVFIIARPAADSAGTRPARREDARTDSGREGERVWRSQPERNSGPSAEDSHGATRGEWRQSAPGQAPGGRSWADAGGPGGAPVATDANRPNAGSHPGRGGEAAPAGPGDGQERGRLPGPSLGSGAPADPRGEGLEVRPVEPDRDERQAAERGGGDAAADADGGRWRPEPGEPGRRRRSRLRAAEREPGDIAWGAYGPAIARWEAVLGRPAPAPTEPGRTGQRLSPRFVEWMQGLPEGWVTDVPGLSRNAMLKALGNGVVPQQAALALRLLLDRAGSATEAGEAA